MIDINGFKKINDAYGHTEGDAVLVIVADTLREVTANCTTPIFLCRYGGTSFCL